MCYIHNWRLQIKQYQHCSATDDVEYDVSDDGGADDDDGDVRTISMTLMTMAMMMKITSFFKLSKVLENLSLSC